MRLIITADDVGLCPHVNAAVADLARAGQITSASLFAPDRVDGLDVLAPTALLAAGTGVGLGVHLRGLDPADYPRQVEQVRAMLAGPPGAGPGRALGHLDFHTVAAYTGPGAGERIAAAVRIAARDRLAVRLPVRLPQGLTGAGLARAHAQLGHLPVRRPTSLLLDPAGPGRGQVLRAALDRLRTDPTLAPAAVVEVLTHPATGDCDCPGVGAGAGGLDRAADHALLASGAVTAWARAHDVALTNWHD